MKILVAEDDEDSSQVLTTNLTHWGHEVVVTADGLEAWNILQQEDAPRMAILDWMMPGIEGTEVCRRLRRLETPMPAYVILLTARSGIDEVINGLQSGADDYLTKPYHSEELRLRVQAGVRMIELQEKLADRVSELQTALDQMKRLQGILPICGYCKKIRNDSDYWQNVESYISSHSEAEFSHSICPPCFETKVKPELDQFNVSN
jgi:phosphoserine phosphatase RsbU/P